MTFSVIDGEGNGRLAFIAAALKAFSFLERLGFRVSRRQSTLVRFETDSVFINVYHGLSSYQIGLELGRVQQDELYSLHEVLSAMAPSDLDRARCQATDPAVLESCLETIAETVERCCQLLLRGDEKEFTRLQSIVSPMREATTLQAQFGAILDRADYAWEQKHLSEAADLYEQAVPALDEMRRRRLDYLRRHRNGP